MSALLQPDPDTLAEVARELAIIDHASKTVRAWSPNREQMTAWEDLYHHRKTYFLKGRQIGMSTAVILYDVLWVTMNDAAGERVKCLLIWDTEDKGLAQIETAAWFCAQLGISHDPGTARIRWPNGSKLEHITAGGQAAGRSLTFQRVHASEMPWWRRASKTWAGMQASIDGAEATLETTMGLDEPLAADLWTKPNDWHKRFFTLESHDLYRADPRDLAPKDEEMLRKEGFTRLDTMAWAAAKIRDDFNGDKIEFFREYPQTALHPFVVAEGRWVRADPKVTEHIFDLDVEGFDGRVWTVDVYRRPEDCKAPVIAHDPALGKGGDNAVVLVIDAADDAICASFATNRCAPDDLALVIKSVWTHYTEAREVVRGGLSTVATIPPPVVIEPNGIGGAVVLLAKRAGVPVIEHVTDQHNKFLGMNYARRAIEEGRAFGPMLLAEEARDCRLERKQFVGKKDALMTLGIGYQYIEKNPWRPPPQGEKGRVVELGKKLKRHRRGQW